MSCGFIHFNERFAFSDFDAQAGQVNAGGIANTHTGLGCDLDVFKGDVLERTFIQALEEDDHDRLPGPVFVRGYLRNYARLLDLEDSVLVVYAGHCVRIS